MAISEFLHALRELRVHHIGLVVPRISDFGHSQQVTVDVNQMVKIMFIDCANTKIELLEPLGEESPVHNSLKKRAPLVHICFEVERIFDGIELLKSGGFVVVHAPADAIAFPGRKIAWLYHKDFGLFELLGHE